MHHTFQRIHNVRTKRSYRTMSKTESSRTVETGGALDLRKKDWEAWNVIKPPGALLQSRNGIKLVRLATFLLATGENPNFLFRYMLWKILGGLVLDKTMHFCATYLWERNAGKFYHFMQRASRWPIEFIDAGNTIDLRLVKYGYVSRCLTPSLNDYVDN